jgi:hypothetical protein
MSPKASIGDDGDASRTVTASTETVADVETVVALLTDAARIPRWAPAFADEVSGPIGSKQRAVKDGVAFDFRVVSFPEAGVVDYLRGLPGGGEGGARVRTTPRPGGGSVVTMTLPLLPGTDPAQTASTLQDELAALSDLAARSADAPWPDDR